MIRKCSFKRNIDCFFFAFLYLLILTDNPKYSIDQRQLMLLYNI